MTFAVRPASPADAPRLAEVHVACWRETYGDIVEADIIETFDVVEREAMWAHALTTREPPEMVAAVAEKDGVMVGFGCAMPSRLRTPARERELGSLYTLASVHGLGVGAALLEAAVGDKPAEVWLATANGRATAFYRKHGFVEDGVTGTYDRWRMPEKRMVR